MHISVVAVVYVAYLVLLMKLAPNNHVRYDNWQNDWGFASVPQKWPGRMLQSLNLKSYRTIKCKRGQKFSLAMRTGVDSNPVAARNLGYATGRT